MLFLGNWDLCAQFLDICSDLSYVQGLLTVEVTSAPRLLGPLLILAEVSDVLLSDDPII